MAGFTFKTYDKQLSSIVILKIYILFRGIHLLQHNFVSCTTVEKVKVKLGKKFTAPGDSEQNVSQNYNTELNCTDRQIA